MKVGVVIAAGGASSRMGFNKLLAELNGIPAIVRTVLAFDTIEQVEQIVVVTSDQQVKNIIANCPFKHEISFADGGENRFLSAKNGFDALSGCDFVAVHDGARPFVTADEIKMVFSEAYKHSAAILAVPAKETVKITQGGFIALTPPRENLYMAQTPQVFSCNLYKKSLELAEEREHDSFTDDSQLVEQTGAKVKICEGSYNNIKLTTPADMAQAEQLAKKQDSGKDG